MFLDVSPSFGEMGVAVHKAIVSSALLQETCEQGADEDSVADNVQGKPGSDVHTDTSSLHFQLVLHVCWLLIKVSLLRHLTHVYSLVTLFVVFKLSQFG